jgi:hypothetical protein
MVLKLQLPAGKAADLAKQSFAIKLSVNVAEPHIKSILPFPFPGIL